MTFTVDMASLASRPIYHIMWTDFYSKTNQMHQCLKFILFWNYSTCFRRSFCPSSNRYCYCLL